MARWKTLVVVRLPVRTIAVRDPLIWMISRRLYWGERDRFRSPRDRRRRAVKSASIADNSRPYSGDVSAGVVALSLSTAAAIDGPEMAGVSVGRRAVRDPPQSPTTDGEPARTYGRLFYTRRWTGIAITAWRRRAVWDVAGYVTGLTRRRCSAVKFIDL